PGTPERARYLQWLHFAESTAYPPLGIVVWLVVYRGEAESQAELVADARARARSGFDFLEAELGEGPWLLGDDFTAADVMMGFTLAAARLLAVIDDESHPRTAAYFARLASRPAFVKAAGLT
ncbi:MAG: glutathione S-transferase, partial [Myxococcales bacterium]|nr:glutathione S-transferase [Myxococcales bacterium]